VRAHGVIFVLVVLVVLGASAISGLADDGLKCSTFGATCGIDGTVVAAADGDITGNLYYVSANFPDVVRVIDTNPNNSWTSPWLLNNQLGVGQPAVNFGHALQGDILVVQLCDLALNATPCANTSKNPYVFSNDPTHSADNTSHAMVAMNGGACATANCSDKRTQLLWFEDLATKQNSDWDYNDMVVSLHNIDVLFPHTDGSLDAPVPEPATLSLLAGGLLAGVIRRAKKN